VRNAGVVAAVLCHDLGMAERSGRRRLVLMGVIDIAVALAVAVSVFSSFGAVSGDDTNPPVCHNGSGGVVSCSLTTTALMLPTFGVVLSSLAAWQLNAARRRRKG
jgi:hypothetical protein